MDVLLLMQYDLAPNRPSQINEIGMNDDQSF